MDNKKQILKPLSEITYGVIADGNYRRNFEDPDENKLKAEGVDIFDKLLLVLRHVVLTYLSHMLLHVRPNFGILTVNNVSCHIFPFLILHFDTFSDAPTYTNLAFFLTLFKNGGEGSNQ